MTHRELLLLQLAYLTHVYKSDFIALMHDPSNSSSTIRAMKKRNWIIEYKLTKLGSTLDETSVIAIDYEGRKYLMKKFKDRYYINMAREAQKPFNTNDLEILHRRLTDNRLKVRMIVSGAYTLMPDKPSLQHLYYEAVEEEMNDENDDVNYDNSMSLDETLNNGVYYSYREIVDFIEAVRGKQEFDTMSGARLRGVYVDKNKTILCYIQIPNRYRRIRVMENVEIRAIKTIAKYFSKLNGIASVDALIVSAGNKLIKEMCSHVDNGNKNYVSLIDWNNDLFDHIYITPRTSEGIKELKYLRTYNYDKWVKDSATVFANTPIESIDNITGNPYLTGRNNKTGHRAIFLPFYDTKLLLMLRTFHDEVDVVTRADMVDTVANIIQRDNEYYTIDGEKQTPVYVGVTPKEKKKYVRHYRRAQVGLSADDIKKIKTICSAYGISCSAYIRSKVRADLNQDYEQAQEKIKNQKMLRKVVRQER